MPESQPVLTPISEAAIFLVLTVRAGAEDAVRDVLADVSALQRSVGFRLPEGELTLRGRASAPRCGTGCSAGRAPGGAAPVRGARRARAPGAGDARRPAAAPARAPPRPVLRAGPAADGPAARRWPRSSTRCTASAPSTSATCSASSTAPRARPARAAPPRSIGDEDPEFAGGSYVIVQKYLHDLDTWDALTVEEQERAIGRTQALGHRDPRRRQAARLPRRADHDRRPRRRGAADRPLQHALRPGRGAASSAPTSSATPARRT